MVVIVFEDEQVRGLHPITVGRPAFAISCGSYRLLDWLVLLPHPIHAVVRPHLQAILEADFPACQPHWPAAPAGRELWVNARLVPSVANYQALLGLLAAGTSAAVWCGNVLAAALLPEPAATAERPTPDTMQAYLAAHCIGAPSPTREVPFRLFEFPHEVVRFHEQILADNLRHRLQTGDYREIADGVFAAPQVELDSHVVIRTRLGPVLLDRGARIGPYTLLEGPAYVGPATRVSEHAAIKHHVAIGHTAKIGGEVAASVIEAYSNKQHHGFLGHSYLGSWINLGAGTCNSDLKNTYGEVNMEYRGHRVATGMQFVGCIMGDYAKTAINTGIFTGKTIGVCSMLYGFVTANVPSFVNYARLFGQITQLPPDVMISTQRRMFARRNVSQRPCDVQLIHDMFTLTESEREATLSTGTVAL